MGDMHCEPASSIIQLLGGLTLVSQRAKTTVTTVQRWRLPSEKGGTGGHIPRKYHSLLLGLAAERGIALPAVAFMDVGLVPLAPAKSEAAA